MKISEETLSVLNNFSSVNAAISIDEGSEIVTISEGKNIIAKAVVDETFSRKFGIYQLGEFLSAVSLLEDPSFDFQENNVNIKSGNSRHRITYQYCDPTLITLPPEGAIDNFPDSDYAFELRAEDLKALLRSAGVLSLPHISIESSDKGIEVCVCNKEIKSGTNAFTLSIDESTISRDENNLPQLLPDDYRMVFNVENLKMIPGNYDVNISNKGIGQFVNQDVDVVYWISAEAQYSTVSK